MQEHATIKLDSSLVSLFLNRCHLSFKQMMFESLSQLKLAISKYLCSETDYEYPHAPMLYEKWVQQSASSIETSMTQTTTADQMDNIEKLTRDATRNKSYHMRHLLTSLVNTFAKNDQKAVDDLHRYFDY
mmetsp:Transcript_41401/g.54480  ORF Transcript_41401/g.54480 Transcript_41401/m.54480 type:complete len:130 (-) Transcript_41401:134-523(-)